MGSTSRKSDIGVRIENYGENRWQFNDKIRIKDII
jgi:hypothetical protein